ncbi:3'(2'),5'-bisphosphate nucleotidase CysQ [Piscinibacter sakaiensis]|uniref:3'(2'),5'-bisphosphate nucleotidase CysQ n=1 Tax=Piscinibacter sakaiensis TaxID=1547922 RepID=UPI003AAFE59F
MPSIDDHRLAARLATEAGRLLLAVRAEFAGAPAAQLREAGDQRAHAFLMHQLRAERPGDAVLSEEGADDPARLDAPRTWIVDPLDGTREFGEPQRTDWTVHVALVVAGRPIAGAVAQPALGITLASEPAPMLPPPHQGPLRIVASRSRTVPAAATLVQALDGELLLMGSAGAKAMAVLRGEAEVYVHAGGQYEWDSCAPVAVALAAGLHASRLDGTPLRYNNRDTYLPDLLICRPELARRCLEVVAAEA